MTPETDTNRRHTLKLGLAATGQMVSSPRRERVPTLAPVDAVQTVRAALLRHPGLVPAPTPLGQERGETPSLPALREQVDLGWRTYQAAGIPVSVRCCPPCSIPLNWQRANRRGTIG